MKKIMSITVISALMVTSLSPFVTFGETAGSTVKSAYKLTELYDRAVSTDVQAQTLEKTMDDIWKQQSTMMSLSLQLQDTLDMLARFKTLHEKKTVKHEAFSVQENIDYMIYKAVFGNTPPNYTDQEMLDLYIKNRDFPHYSLYTEYRKLKNSKESIKPTLEVNLYKLSVQWNDLKDTLAGQRIYEGIMATKLKEATSKYKLGKISKLAYEEAVANQDMLKMQNDNIARSINTLEMNIMSMCGIDPSTTFTISDEMLIGESYKIEAFKVYQEAALKNRSEVLNADLDEIARTREYEIIKQYLSNKLTTDYLSYEKGAIESVDAAKAARATVTKDVMTLYKDLVKADLDLKNYSNKYSKETKSFKTAELSYKKGMISKSDFDLATYKYQMALSSYKAANRKVGSLLNSMTYATGLGPAYSSKVGVTQ